MNPSKNQHTKKINNMSKHSQFNKQNLAKKANNVNINNNFNKTDNIYQISHINTVNNPLMSRKGALMLNMTPKTTNFIEEKLKPLSPSKKVLK
jgi:hypothetical protein